MTLYKKELFNAGLIEHNQLQRKWIDLKTAHNIITRAYQFMEPYDKDKEQPDTIDLLKLLDDLNKRLDAITQRQKEIIVELQVK